MVRLASSKAFKMSYSTHNNLVNAKIAQKQNSADFDFSMPSFASIFA